MTSDGEAATRAPEGEDHLIIRHHLTHFIADEYVHRGTITIEEKGLYEILPVSREAITYRFLGSKFQVRGGLMLSGNLVLGDQLAEFPSTFTTNPNLVTNLFGDVHIEHGTLTVDNVYCGFNQIGGAVVFYPNLSRMDGAGKIIVSGDLQAIDKEGTLSKRVEDLQYRIAPKLGVYRNMEACEQDKKVIEGVGADDHTVLTFLDVAAIYDGKSVIVSWSLDGYEEGMTLSVERSADKQFFGSIDATVKPLKERSFYAIDKQPYTAQGYYRIKVITRDGTVQWSRIVQVQHKNFAETTAEIKVYPNPAQRGQNVNVALANLQPVSTCEVTMKNMMGQIVYRTAMLTDANGSVLFSLPLEVRAGTYYVSTASGKGTQTQKISVF